jgi:hypothetical protein
MTFLVEWCVTRACFLMSFNGTLPSQQPSQALSSIVGASPCGCPRLGLLDCPGKPCQGWLPSSHLPGKGSVKSCLMFAVSLLIRKQSTGNEPFQDRSVDRDAELLGGVHACVVRDGLCKQESPCRSGSAADGGPPI